MHGTYNPWLVALSVCVAIVASYTALDLAGRSLTRGRAAFWRWLCVGSVVLGSGIWSMHFVGMLAFRLSIPVAFETGLTALSFAVAVGASGVALFAMSRAALGRERVALGAIVIGIGIASMHYTGMAAMRMSPPITYDTVPLVASVLIAIVASWVALSLPVHVRARRARWVVPTKFASSFVMGVAISGMHYTGMAAAVFAADSVCTATGVGVGIGNDVLAVAIGVATLFVLIATLLVAALDSQSNVYLQGANQKLREVALFDELTGLPNRTLLQDRFDQAVRSAVRDKRFVGILFVDLDRFKGVNDLHGHRAGDSVLRDAGRRMVAAVRADDTVARMGGDEFVVLITALTRRSDLTSLAEKVTAELERDFEFEGVALSISASIGTSIYPDDGQALEPLLGHADRRMYESKWTRRGVPPPVSADALIPLAGLDVR